MAVIFLSYFDQIANFLVLNTVKLKKKSVNTKHLPTLRPKMLSFVQNITKKKKSSSKLYLAFLQIGTRKTSHLVNKKKRVQNMSIKRPKSGIFREIFFVLFTLLSCLETIFAWVIQLAERLKIATKYFVK